MIQTKCEKCMFAKPVDTLEDISLSCSQGIINKIKDHKKITQENNYNLIEEYACRYGFAQEVYNQNKEEIDKIDFLDHINKNAYIKYYLILDIQTDTNLDELIQNINSLDVPPSLLSLMFRNHTERAFTKKDQELVNNLAKIRWKSHSFTYPVDLEFGIDHVLSTNIDYSQSLYFLVYNSSEISDISSYLDLINETLVVKQMPNAAIVKDYDNLYGLFMSFENYKVAKYHDHYVSNTIKNKNHILKI